MIMHNNKCLVAPARSGSTWACDLLNELDSVVALDEPFSREDLSKLDVSGFLDLVEATFQSERERIIKQKQAYSTKAVGTKGLGNHYGRVDGQTGLRARQVDLGLIDIEKELRPDFTLVCKHTIPFTGVIDQLVSRYPTYVLVRNPLAILVSWNSIDASYREGRIQPYADALTGNLTERLNSSNRLERQVRLLEWHFERFLFVPEERVYRYEDIVTAGLGPLKSIVGPTAQRKTSPLVAKGVKEMDELLRLLTKLPKGSPIFSFYDLGSIRELHERMSSKNMVSA
ncbi:MAG: hypothetical protein ACR2RE_02370 [Geminicoccaceae bacterium]